MNAKRAMFGGFLWLLCSQFFVAEQIARLAWQTPYSMTANYISDLGAIHCSTSLAGSRGIICSPMHGLMNGSFMLQGLLILAGALLAHRFFPKGKFFTAALCLIAIAGIGVFTVGLAPEDVHPRTHSLAATQHFLFGNAGMALLGAALLFRTRASGWLGSISLLMGSAGLLAMMLLFQRIFLGFGIGGMERIAAYPFPLWLTGTGAVILLRRGIAG